MADDTQESNKDRKRSTQERRVRRASNLDETQANTTESDTRNMSPPIQGYSPPQNQTPPPPPQQRQRQSLPPRTRPPAPRQGKARSRRDSGLYLPLWSLALMVLVVIAIVVGVILLFLNLGGRPAPEREPVLLIDTAVPTLRPNAFPISPATSTIPPDVDPNLLDVIPSAPPIILEGPTLFIPTLSPTPRPIEIGVIVLVTDVGDQELNIRNEAGVTNSTVVFRSPENTRFMIVDGPRQGDGLTWWQIQDVLDPSRVGWAASNYLIPESIESTNGG